MRSYWSQCRELLLIGLTYNLMLIYATVGLLRSSSDTFLALDGLFSLRGL